MLSRIPLSFGLFGLMALVLVIEALLAQTWLGEVISIALLMPLWSIAIINAVFIGIGIEVFARNLSKFWLLVPCAWFVGNAAFAAPEQAAVQDLRREIAATNARSKLPFDPARDALVLGDGLTPNDILGHYNVPQVYVRSKDPVNEPPYMVYRLTDRQVCFDDAKEGASRTAANWSREGWVKNPVLGELGGYCVIGMAAAAPARPVVVSKFPAPGATARGVPVSIVRLHIERPGEARIEARIGTAKPLPWLPLPWVACMYDRTAPDGMTCTRHMDRWTAELSDFSDVELIGRMLSLPPGPSEQSVNSAEEVWKLVGQAGSYRRNWQIRRFDAFLANPDDPAPVKVPLLEKDRGAIMPRIPRILALAARDTGEDSSRHDKICDAFGLVLTLDAVALRPHRLQLRKLAAADDCYGNQYDIVTGENLRPDPEAEAAAEEARQEAEVAAAAKREAAEAARHGREPPQPSSTRPQRPPSPPSRLLPYRGPLAVPTTGASAPRHP